MVDLHLNECRLPPRFDNTCLRHEHKRLPTAACAESVDAKDLNG